MPAPDMMAGLAVEPRAPKSRKFGTGEKRVPRSYAKTNNVATVAAVQAPLGTVRTALPRWRIFSAGLLLVAAWQSDR